MKKVILNRCLIFLVCGILSGPASALMRDIGIALVRLTVHDDCDNVSAGDWFVGMAISDNGAELPRQNPSFIFPNATNAMDIDTGDSISLFEPLILEDVLLGNNVSMSINTIDCDSNFFSVPLALFVPIYPLIPGGFLSLDTLVPLASFDPNCEHEEEIIESSGDADHPGFVRKVFSPFELNTPAADSVDVILPEKSMPSTSVSRTRCVAVEISEPGGLAPSSYTAGIRIRLFPIEVDGSTIVPVISMML